MPRTIWGALAGLLLVASAFGQAGPTVPAGNYKLVLLVRHHPVFWLLKLDTKDGKVTVDLLGTNDDEAPEAKVGDIQFKDGVLNMTFRTPQGQRFQFEGKVTADATKPIQGSISLGAQMAPAQLESTKLKSLDTFETSLETINDPAAGAKVFSAALTLIRQAGTQKAKAEDVRSWASKALKTAEMYGPTWHREMAVRVAEALAKDATYPDVALQYARQAERLLGPGDKAQLQRRVLTVLHDALSKAGKDDEAKEVKTKLDKIEIVSVVKYQRKNKSDRAVVVELFTGAECPPCVAADLAFDALGKTFSAKDVILLQYHLHIPGPDPLTNPDTEARALFYGENIEGTPTIFFNGRPDASGGGGKDAAQEKYEEYLGVIEPLLDTLPRVTLKLSAVQKGAKIDITAEASDVEKPSDKMRLRLALIEEEVNYTGRNKLSHHHYVVRSLPGGMAGLPLKDKTGTQKVTVDLDELRKKLNDYLTESNKDNPFPNKDRPLEMKKLKVVAFIQNDATREILQAAQVDVKE